VRKLFKNNTCQCIYLFIYLRQSVYSVKCAGWSLLGQQLRENLGTEILADIYQ